MVSTRRASLPQLSQAKNVITIPKGVIWAPSFLRVYRADDSKGVNGGVDLPQVHAFDGQSGLAVNQCAPLKIPIPKSFGINTHKKPLDRSVVISPNIRHYHGKGAGLYPNKHNYYLTTKFDRTLGDLVVVKWKAATTPDTREGGGVFNHQQQVRYWSYCLGESKPPIPVIAWWTMMH